MGSAVGGYLSYTIGALTTYRHLAHDPLLADGTLRSPNENAALRQAEGIPAVTNPLGAAASNAPRLHDNTDTNVAFRGRRTAGDAVKAFQEAAYTVRQRMTSQRLAPVAMEPRGVLACPASDGRLEIHLSTQRPHGSQNWLSRILGIPQAQLHVIAGDDGPGTLLGRLGPMLPQAYRFRHFDVELVGVFAYTTVTGLTYETGDYHAGLDLLMEKPAEPHDNTNQSPERPLASHEGQLFGRGIATFVEPGGIVPRAPGPDGAIGDQATVTIDPDGKVTVAVGTSGHGQGHETAFAQLAADLLDVPYDAVTVTFGDTDTASFGYGTFGSRSLAAGGTAIHHACQAALDAARRVDAPMSVTEAAARLGVTPALVNAVMEALAPYDIRHLDMPLTPESAYQTL